jgi:hypothetical protein
MYENRFSEILEERKEGVQFIFLHSSTMVSVADLTHPHLPAHSQLIYAKK